MCIREGKSHLKGHTVHDSTPGCSGKATATGTVKGWGGRCQGWGVWGRELFFKRWRCSASVWEDETVLEMDGGGGRTV